MQAATSLSRPYRGFLADEIQAGALYGYVLALRAWRDGGGAPFRRYAWRRMQGEAWEVRRNYAKHATARLEYEPGASAAELSEPEPLLRLIAFRTSHRAARAAWLCWGLGYPVTLVARAMHVTPSRIHQLLKCVRRAFGSGARRMEGVVR